MGNESDLSFKTLRRHPGDQALSFSVSPEFSIQDCLMVMEKLICKTVSDSRQEERNPKRENSQPLFSIADKMCPFPQSNLGERAYLT